MPRDMKISSENVGFLNRLGGRVNVYDWLRLIATIYVVIGHSAYLNIQTTYGGVSYVLPENLNYIYNSLFLRCCRTLSIWVYGFHMPLFFMLSGAVLALKPDISFDKFFRSKVKRLLIPYFVYGWLFMLPIKRLGNFYNNDTLKEAMKGFLSGTDSGHLWFLTALFWCTMIFAVIKRIMVKLESDSIYVTLLLCGLIQMTVSYIPIDVIGLKTGLGYIFYFAMGYVFECERRSRERWNIRTTIFAFVFVLFIEIFNLKYGLLNSFFAIIAGSFMTYLLSDICDRGIRNINENKCWNLVIRNLFYVYLFHDPLEYIVLRLFMDKNWLSSGFGCIAYTFSRTVLIFIICICLGEIVYKIKNVFGRYLTLSEKSPAS